MAKKGHTTAILEATRQPEHEHDRPEYLLEIAVTLAESERLVDLQACLSEIDSIPRTTEVAFAAMRKARVVVDASIGAVLLTQGDEKGRDALAWAQYDADDLPNTLPHKAETFAIIGAMCASWRIRHGQELVRTSLALSRNA